MSDDPPSNPIFDQAPGRSTGVTRDAADWYGLARNATERTLLDSLKPRLERRQSDNKVVFKPFLMLRTFVGDSGQRPFGGVFWESPDIWIYPDDPTSAPPVPPTTGGNPVARQPNTLYAHVWNLGLAPMIGMSVEFLVFNPSIAFAGQTPLFRAVTRVDLAGRSTPNGCHKLVKCPQPWVPTIINDGHECVIVRLSGVGDTPSHPFEPAHDRHIGQRNLHVDAFDTAHQQLLGSLQQTLPEGADLQFFMIGPEAQPVVDLVAPGLTVNREVRTRRIGSVQDAPVPPRGQATVVRIQGVMPGQSDNPEVIGGYTLVLR